MKKLFLLLVAVASISMTSYAQTVAYVDVSVVLDAMPEYGAAQRAIEQTAEKWKQEIEQKYSEIEEMYSRYQAEQVLLSDKARKQREEEIVQKEKQVRGLQQKRFGPGGELFKKRQSLVKPIQDKVHNSIEEYSNEKGIDIMFDKSSGVNIIFANPKYDKTDDLLSKLGVKKKEDK